MAPGKSPLDSRRAPRASHTSATTGCAENHATVAVSVPAIAKTNTFDAEDAEDAEEFGFVFSASSGSSASESQGRASASQSSAHVSLRWNGDSRQAAALSAATMAN